MALLDVLERRGALRVLWELSQAQEPLTFRELRHRCDDMSSSVLSTRLGELRDASLVARAPTGYELDEHGRSLVAHLLPLHHWSEAWARRPAGTRRRGAEGAEPPASG